jgi:hypothetical protein
MIASFGVFCLLIIGYITNEVDKWHCDKKYSSLAIYWTSSVIISLMVIVFVMTRASQGSAQEDSQTSGSSFVTISNRTWNVGKHHLCQRILMRLPKPQLQFKTE